MEQSDIIIPAYKPVGLSTYDLIRIYKRKNNFCGKIGHGGTLDPFACGLVLLLLGKETKKFDEIKFWQKTYVAGIKLGSHSTTGDIEGSITENLCHNIDYKELKSRLNEILPEFIGEIEQKVPSFSAAKQNGKPLYELARSGAKIIEKYKKVKIQGIEFIALKYPLLTIRVKCSGGTYIRQLAEDIGNKLNTKAYLYFLQRETIGDYNIKNSLELI